MSDTPTRLSAAFQTAEVLVELMGVDIAACMHACLHRADCHAVFVWRVDLLAEDRCRLLAPKNLERRVSTATFSLSLVRQYLRVPALGSASTALLQRFHLHATGSQRVTSYLARTLRPLLSAAGDTVVEGKRFQGGFHGGASKLWQLHVATMDECLLRCLAHHGCRGVFAWRLAKEVGMRCVALTAAASSTFALTPTGTISVSLMLR